MSILAYMLSLFIVKPRPMVRRRTEPAYQPKFGDVDVRERLTEPVAEPVDPPSIDPLFDLKLRLRTLAYGDFMKAAAGMGFAPQTAWEWATA